MYRPSGDAQIDRLNVIAVVLAKKREAGFGVLSIGEQCYVALASNRVDLLRKIGYTIPEALARLGPEWTNALIACWQYAGDPEGFA